MSDSNESINIDKSTDMYFKQMKTSVDDQARYTSIVCSIFYAALIAFYCTISNDLPNIAKKHFIISFVISVSIFVLNEIINMLRAYNELKFCNEKWTEYFKKKLSFSELQNKIAEKSNEINKYNFHIWIVLFTFGCISGLYAIISLIVLATKL